MERYARACQKEFWQEVFKAEIDYLQQHLGGSRDVLSVGCGPAILEGALAERGFRVTGLDVSRETLGRAPDCIGRVAARAEEMPFLDSAFDAVISIASLQFVDDYRKAMLEAARALHPAGKLIVMLLNPGSVFFKEKISDAGSYVRKIKHVDNLSMQERSIATAFRK